MARHTRLLTKRQNERRDFLLGEIDAGRYGDLLEAGLYPEDEDLMDSVGMEDQAKNREGFDNLLDFMADYRARRGIAYTEATRRDRYSSHENAKAVDTCGRARCARCGTPEGTLLARFANGDWLEIGSRGWGAHDPSAKPELLGGWGLAATTRTDAFEWAARRFRKGEVISYPAFARWGYVALSDPIDYYPLTVITDAKGVSASLCEPCWSWLQIPFVFKKERQ